MVGSTQILVACGGILFFAFSFLAKGTGTHLDETLADYDIIYAGDVQRRLVKRGAANPNPSRYNHIQELTVSSKFEKPLRIFLTPKQGLFTADFKASTVNPVTNKEEPFFMDLNDFYGGHVFGSNNSRVSLNFDDDGTMTGSVQTDSDTYMFEPAIRHINVVSPAATLMYRISDIRRHAKANKQPRCGFIDIDAGLSRGANASAGAAKKASKRARRAATSRTRCSLKLVADYRFYGQIGANNLLTASRYLVNVIDRVNEIYLSTVWEDSPGDPEAVKDRGFVIKKILIHQYPTRNPPRHYNTDRLPGGRTHWDVANLLALFTKTEGSNEFCLVHLFTFQSFEGGVLGLGYMAMKEIGSSGGICSAAGRDYNLYFNTALSSARSTRGNAVITREADIVTAHELGHNWGSSHDGATAECSPAASRGGSYIMNTFSVSGYDANNKIFSPCSKRLIKAVLVAKSDLCFQEATERFCGNQRVETGRDNRTEQCDVGLDHRHDRCCHADTCLLRPGMKCSPLNSPCCTEGCTWKARDAPCQPSDQHNCKQASVCTGNSGECPKPKPFPDGTECFFEGECQNGECVHFCERRSIGMKPCICENVSESCFRCCRPAWPRGECRPFERAPRFPLKRYANGEQCVHGFCDSNGDCIKKSQDVVEHLWNIIQGLDISTVRKFLEDNLVGTVILLSLLVWIPASCFVRYIDKQRELQHRKEWDWLTGDRRSSRVEVVRDVKTVHYSPTTASYI